MSLFRKKPITIEARRLIEPASPHDIADWCNGKACGLLAEVHPHNRPWIEIETLEGVMQALYGDWIIKGVNGEFYPCKDDVFQKTYTPNTQSTCVWKQDDDGNWDTQCDNLFIIIDGTPAENSMQFCPYCGKTINEGDPNAD